LALKRIGTEHPEAVGEVTPRLRAGFTGEDPVKQGATAEVIKETAEADPTVVVELVPELTNLLVGSVPELTDLEETAVRSGSLGPEQARSDAGEALERIGVHRPKPVKTALSRLSDDIHSFGTDIRTQIAKLLRGGAEAHPSVFLDFYPELTALLDDEVYEVRKNAAVALAAISEGDPTDLAVHRSKFRELIAHEDTTHEGKVVLVGVLCRLGSETVVDPVADR
jgi:HEAT repeat protein